MTIQEALQILNIEEYSDRIFHSNSHGELIHLVDYIVLADSLGKTDWFRDWFKHMVSTAEKECKRPDVIFQHIPKILYDTIKHYND